jgi:putative SOS response-associated peptidase YedK
MCNIYGSLDEDQLELFLGLDDALSWEQPTWAEPIVAPLKPGVFVAGGPDRLRVLVGQWGMIPPDSEDRVPRAKPKPGQKVGTRLSTNNARRERMKTAWTFRRAWARGQRCLIPAAWYDEPYWGISHADPMAATFNTWWRFRRADGEPWMLAGLWDEWTDPHTGEVVLNYTMVTQNCDGHPVLALMHKPDPKLPPDKQDKRAVVPIERADWSTWLRGGAEEAESLIRVPPVETLNHGPADAGRTDRLPV